MRSAMHSQPGDPSEEFFALEAQDGAARAGRMRTAHGAVPTPCFMPVGTLGAVKTLAPDELAALGAPIMLANAYHLALRPGAAALRARGGLHAWSGWPGALLTDSGGYQVFSLAARRKIEEEGVEFRSHLDGSPLKMTPESSIEVQDAIGSDIAMVLDECPPAGCTRAEAQAAMERSLRWAERSARRAAELNVAARGGRVFAIAQGGVFPDLRRRAAEAVGAMACDGCAIGGVSVGEPEALMLEAVAAAAAALPAERPRYVMGIGDPVQMLEMVALGADMFDCVQPTRLARHGTAFCDDGRMNLRTARWAEDDAPLSAESPVRSARSWLRHLVRCGDPLGARLLTQHNVWWFLRLMARAREEIAAGEGRFDAWRRAFSQRFRGGGFKCEVQR